MPTPMHVYREIALRYDSNLVSEDDFDNFFQETICLLSIEERQQIFDELMAREGELEDCSDS